MNCKHHIRFLKTAYKLICTTYPQRSACEKPGDNSEAPIKPRLSSFCDRNYSQFFGRLEALVNKSSMSFTLKMGEKINLDTSFLQSHLKTMRFVPLALTTLRLILGPMALTVAMSGGPRWTY